MLKITIIFKNNNHHSRGKFSDICVLETVVCTDPETLADPK